MDEGGWRRAPIHLFLASGSRTIRILVDCPTSWLDFASHLILYAGREQGVAGCYAAPSPARMTRPTHHSRSSGHSAQLYWLLKL